MSGICADLGTCAYDVAEMVYCRPDAIPDTRGHDCPHWNDCFPEPVGDGS